MNYAYYHKILVKHQWVPTTVDGCLLGVIIMINSVGVADTRFVLYK